MVSSRPEIDTRLGFGRGSAVREYWLSRCQGFSVVSADGHHLGRVKRIETQVEGTLLRLTGLRGRIFPLSAIDTVWPSASLLVISDEHVDDRSEVSVGAERADKHPGWTEDTVPWWELVDGVRARQSERANGPYQGVRPRSARLRLDTPRIRTPAFSLKRAEPLAKWFAAWATNFVERSQEMGRTFARKLIRAKRATIRALGSARMTAHTAVLALTRRTRLRIARSLFRMGLWAYGSNPFALEARRDRRVEVDERDTEEIDLGSGWA